MILVIVGNRQLIKTGKDMEGMVYILMAQENQIITKLIGLPMNYSKVKFQKVYK